MRRPLTVCLLALAAGFPAPVVAQVAIAPTPAIPAGVWFKGPDVTIHWVTGQWSPIATQRTVMLTARAGTSTSSASVAVAPGQTRGSITIRGLTHERAYRFGLRAIQGPTLLPSEAVGPLWDLGVHSVDSTAPTTVRFVLNDNAAYTNRYTVSASGRGTDTGTGVVSVELRPTAIGAVGCDLTERNPDGSGCYPVFPFGGFGLFNEQLTLPAGPDGPRTATAVLRDAAFVHCLTTGIGGCTSPEGGNATVLQDTIIVDTGAPVVRLAAGARDGVAGEPLALDASASTDATSGIPDDGYRWDFGDGTPPVDNAAARVSHTYPGPGAYPLEVRVRDRAGNVGVARSTVTVGLAGVVIDPPVVPPVTEPIPDPVVVPAPPAPPVAPAVTPPPVVETPRVRRMTLVNGRLRVLPSVAGLARVRVTTVAGVSLGQFSQLVAVRGTAVTVPAAILNRMRLRERVRFRVRLVADGRIGPIATLVVRSATVQPPQSRR